MSENDNLDKVLECLREATAAYCKSKCTDEKGKPCKCTFFYEEDNNIDCISGYFSIYHRCDGHKWIYTLKKIQGKK